MTQLENIKLYLVEISNGGNAKFMRMTIFIFKKSFISNS